MLDALARIRQIPLPVDPVLGPGTLNVSTIAGGVRPNVIPDSCQAELLFRTVADPAPLKSAVTRAAGDRVTADFAWEVAPIRLRRLPGFETTVVQFTTDLPHFGAWGEGFLLGPGSIRVAHTDHESVAKADLMAATDLYVRLATQLMGED